MATRQWLQSVGKKVKVILLSVGRSPRVIHPKAVELEMLWPCANGGKVSARAFPLSVSNLRLRLKQSPRALRLRLAPSVKTWPSLLQTSAKSAREWFELTALLSFKRRPKVRGNGLNPTPLFASNVGQKCPGNEMGLLGADVCQVFEK